MICKHCEEESTRNEGVEVIKNESCHDEQYGNGQYTEKRFRLPSWIRSFIPNLFYITEKAWNYYPYTLTEYTCSFLPRFSIIVETKYEDNNGTNDNCHNLSKEEVQSRKLEYLDIAVERVPEHKYKLSEDPCKFKSNKTGRGPLTSNWTQIFKPIMCAYKIVRVRFEVWGMQTRAEDYMQRTIRDILVLAHRQAFTWMDEWYDMSMNEVRRYELVTSDYECLTQMNNSALDRYRVMHRTLQHANENLKSMNEANCNRLQATASVLNEIEDSMSNLESTIMHLDAYSRSLETQLKKYEKRPLTITSTTANSPTAS
ncbi:unnamed protein product [Didymodactylos carnosus]|uniref:Phosphatidylinositol transfer protein N-terminal domain-containing protein n=1 Tax=Didymodactylos carnosus TaxID=1234261 RepID=A0A814Z1G0_9BILA|nr:unnamed protein product [Didymodactylos carnosus]CAF1237782.1 unnamed protein product [Didymodactylos carnosus]CAF3809040.1 unnamed protein product [Didymodactylos carnosus]CAF4000073.1 unnamed protein product [Didymodactylos carnosus]